MDIYDMVAMSFAEVEVAIKEIEIVLLDIGGVRPCEEVNFA